MSKNELQILYNKLIEKYKIYKGKNLKLDMSRGKPSPQQLNLSMDLFNIQLNDSNINIDNIDIRNYGCLDGLPSVKKFFSNILNVDESEIIIGGNSSLNLMHDVISNLMLLPSNDNCKPWCKYDKIKFLCPVPGYDRHFSICEKFGIEMINIDMQSSGPDMDAIENLVSNDETIKGIWCVPQYSNPTGITYSNQTVKRFANLRPKAKDFKIFWDNAYILHHLYKQHPTLLNILTECKKTLKDDMVYIFSSTSKISFPGAGLAVIATSKQNINQLKKWFSIQTIGYNKINQIRHLLFFNNIEKLISHMEKHANILRPKFEIVENLLSKNMEGTGLATWSKPLGGYFISLNTLNGCAKKVVSLCKEAGVTFTSAGATFPYGKDPKDNNIRIAPSYPEINELEVSIELFCVAIKIASIEKLINL